MSMSDPCFIESWNSLGQHKMWKNFLKNRKDCFLKVIPLSSEICDLPKRWSSCNEPPTAGPQFLWCHHLEAAGNITKKAANHTGSPTTLSHLLLVGGVQQGGLFFFFFELQRFICNYTSLGIWKGLGSFCFIALIFVLICLDDWKE